jgi:hypothetical protein
MKIDSLSSFMDHQDIEEVGNLWRIDRLQSARIGFADDKELVG